jgi:carbonic anhydrase
MKDSTQTDRPQFNRAAFLAGSLAVVGAVLPEPASSATPGAEAGGVPAPAERLLGRLMAGNKRFVDNDFPMQSRVAEKRELLLDSQVPFAAILGCSDSRVIPNLIFVQGVGDLFVARVAGNYPDDLVIASIEYAIEHLGTRLVVALGHQNCGAVKAVYSAIETKTPLPPHLSTIEDLIAPGITSVVRSHGTIKQAIEANVRAAKDKLRTSDVIASGVKSGRVLVVGGVYQLGSGAVTLVE